MFEIPNNLFSFTNTFLFCIPSFSVIQMSIFKNTYKRLHPSILGCVETEVWNKQSNETTIVVVSQQTIIVYVFKNTLYVMR